MEPDFWRARWSEGRTAFHEGKPNEHLVKHRALLGKATRVFVPLCGKAEDLAYLAANGHEVIGANGFGDILIGSGLKGVETVGGVGAAGPTQPRQGGRVDAGLVVGPLPGRVSAPVSSKGRSSRISSPRLTMAAPEMPLPSPSHRCTNNAFGRSCSGAVPRLRS